MGFFGGGGASASNMVGATSSVAGTAGLVPAPAAGEQAEFLRGDATFANPVALPESRLPPSGHYFGFPSAGYLSETGISQATALNFAPIFVPIRDTYTIIAIHNLSTNASGTARLGLYNFDTTNAKPSTLVVDAGTVSLTTIGIKEASISVTLDRGLYYGAVVASHSVSYFCTGTYTWYYVFNGSHATDSIRHGSNSNGWYWSGTGSNALNNGLPANAQTTGVQFNFNQQSQAVVLKK